MPLSTGDWYNVEVERALRKIEEAQFKQAQLKQHKDAADYYFGRSERPIFTSSGPTNVKTSGRDIDIKVPLKIGRTTTKDGVTKENEMAVYNVTATLEMFKQLEDGSKVKVERLIGTAPNVVANSSYTAVAIAARKFADIDDELLGSAKINAQQVSN